MEIIDNTNEPKMAKHIEMEVLKVLKSPYYLHVSKNPIGIFTIQKGKLVSKPKGFIRRETTTELVKQYTDETVATFGITKMSGRYYLSMEVFDKEISDTLEEFCRKENFDYFTKTWREQ